MDDETYDRLAHGRHCGGQPGRVLGQERLLDGDVYERLTNMAQQARANEAQFLEHLILRAEAIYNFQPPLPLPSRPWWKLWGKDPAPELPPSWPICATSLDDRNRISVKGTGRPVGRWRPASLQG